MSILVVNGKEADSRGKIPACSLRILQIFTRQNDQDFYMRIKPTSYLLNSSLVQENLNNGKPMILNMNQGTVYFIKADEMVRPVETANLSITK